MNNILYINSTISKHSRTDALARHLLHHLQGNVEEIYLQEEFVSGSLACKHASMIPFAPFNHVIELQEMCKQNKKYIKYQTI